MSLLNRRILMMNNMEVEEDMAEWQLLGEITLDEAKNEAFNLKNINCKEIYIFANVGITEYGNTSININDGETEFFTNIRTIEQCKFNTVHCFMVGNRFLAEEIGDYALQGYMETNKSGIHPRQSISETKITSIRLFRNAPGNTFLAGSTFEIWGR